MVFFKNSLSGIVILLLIFYGKAVFAEDFVFDDYAHRLGVEDTKTLKIPNNVRSRLNNITIREKEYTENTLEVYNAFFNYHMKYDTDEFVDISKIEFDVQESKDGKLFIFHDKDFDRFFSNVEDKPDRGIIELDEGEILSLKYPGGESVLSFDRVLLETLNNLKKLKNNNFSPKQGKIEFIVEVKRMKIGDNGWVKLLTKLDQFSNDLKNENINILDIKCYVYSAKVFNKHIGSYERWNNLNAQAGSKVELVVGERWYNFFYRFINLF